MQSLVGEESIHAVVDLGIRARVRSGVDQVVARRSERPGGQRRANRIAGTELEADEAARSAGETGALEMPAEHAKGILWAVHRATLEERQTPPDVVGDGKLREQELGGDFQPPRQPALQTGDLRADHAVSDSEPRFLEQPHETPPRIPPPFGPS